MAAADYFPARPKGRFPSRGKIAGLSHRALRLRCGCPTVRPVGFVAMKAATVAVQPTEHPMRDHDDYDATPESSPTDHVLNELQLHGYRPFADEPDQRPLPDGNRVAGAVADIFDALIGTLEDTRLEPDLDDLLWSTVNVFHRATDLILRELEDN